MAAGTRIGIIGAGPVGLEAALYAKTRGFDVHVFERGRIGEHLLQWGHVRLFTPWSMNVSPWGQELLGLPGPPDQCPTAAELVHKYLHPSCAHPLMTGVVHQNTSVLQVGRENRLKSDMTGRKETQFNLLVEDSRGERWESCDVLIDATGVYGTPNSIGRDGLAAVGERTNRDSILSGLPDLKGESHRITGKDVVIVGSGMSAATSIEAVLSLNPKSVTWLTRNPGKPLHDIEDDPLPERKRLTQAANQSIKDKVKHIPEAKILEINKKDDGLELVLQGNNAPPTLRADLVLANTGFRPDWTMTRELQIHHCYSSEGPMKLAAALLSAEGGDCMTQTSHGAESLTSPEPMFFVLGHKSYGRRSEFLLKLGHEQIQDVFSLIPLPQGITSVG